MGNFTLNVNGKDCAVVVDPGSPLLTVLRENLNLTGAKPGCGEGQCGACTVLLDSHAVRSCITPISEIGQKRIETIESAKPGSKLERVQQAFLRESAFQCGYCTPGMVMGAVALLNKNPHPTVEEIRTGMNGNICRCGTYSRIIKAIRDAAKDLGRA